MKREVLCYDNGKFLINVTELTLRHFKMCSKELQRM